MKRSRRNFIKTTGQLALAGGFMSAFPLIGCNSPGETADTENETENETTGEMFFKISLAQWSLHKALGFNDTKTATLDNLDFAAKAKNDFGIDGIEYVNQFFKDYATDKDYLGQMKQRADDNGVNSLLIMVDGEGNLGAPDDKERKQSVENHYKWVEAAKFLGCHSIRVNSFGVGTPEEVAKAAVDGLGSLATFAKDFGLNVIVENHGSYSSDGNWMTDVMKQINMENCGMLPDFGNFCVERDSGEQWAGECIKEFDRYEGVKLFMPFAKAVSAKSYDFDENGDETKIDFMKIMKTVKDAGYTGYVGVEYEGSRLSEDEGIRATKALLEKVGKALG